MYGRRGVCDGDKFVTFVVIYRKHSVQNVQHGWNLKDLFVPYGSMRVESLLEEQQIARYFPVIIVSVYVSVCV